MNKKKKRHSGWITPRLTILKKDLIAYDLFLDPFYDDWEDYRDGLRDWHSDYKTIKNIKGYYSGFISYEKRIQMNKKQKSLIKRRKIRKSKINYLKHQ